jgi:hypothetical protein
MRTIPLVATLGFVAAMLPLVPHASAVGTCTELLNAAKNPDCPYLFCYGTSWSYPDRYYRCYECFDPFHPECTWPTTLA